MPMSKLLSEHKRISILLALNEAPGFDLNDAILRDVLKIYSLKSSLDQIRTELTWLEQQGYVTVEKIGHNKVWVSTITQSGIDVAEGNVFAPGIKRPAPVSQR